MNRSPAEAITMNIDDFWLDDAALVQVSRRVPSTALGRQLMTQTWPERFPSVCSSESYRGYAIVLSMVCAYIHSGIDLRAIERVIDGVDQCVKTSNTFRPYTDICGGAVLALANAWESAHCGITPAEVVAAYESELIYAAGMFVRARQQGL
jgi:hypothetical protein